MMEGSWEESGEGNSWGIQGGTRRRDAEKEQLQRLRFSDGFPRHIANMAHSSSSGSSNRCLGLRQTNTSIDADVARSQEYRLAAAAARTSVEALYVCVLGKDICLTMKFNGVL